MPSPVSCSSRSAWPIGPTTGPMPCPAVSSSAWRSPSPWPTDPRSCSPTNRPASSTPRPRTRSSTCSGASTRISGSRSSWRPTTRSSATRSTGPWRSATVGSAARSSAIGPLSAEGDHHVVATEYAVLDRAGRLQLPRAHVEALGLERRVRLELEDDHIGVWPDRPEPATRRGRRPVSSPYARPEAGTTARPSGGRGHGRDARPRARFPDGLDRRLGPVRRRPPCRARRAGRRPRSLRIGQDDPPVVDRRARSTDDRPGLRRRRVDRRDGPGRARRHPAAPDRLHLPGLRADLDPVRGRERRGAAAPGRAPSRASARSG